MARSKKQTGGYLEGPSHEQGGIPANIAGGEQVELEGGEYIINAQTVDALGEKFLDKINSTATTYHDGGFAAGELKSMGSKYARGGVIPNRVREHGHCQTNADCSPSPPLFCMQGECRVGGRNWGGVKDSPAPRGWDGGGRRRGGKINRRKMRQGGHTHGNHTHGITSAVQTYGDGPTAWDHKHYVQNVPAQTSASLNMSPGIHGHASAIPGGNQLMGSEPSKNSPCSSHNDCISPARCVQWQCVGPGDSYQANPITVTARQGGQMRKRPPRPIPGNGGGPGMPPPNDNVMVQPWCQPWPDCQEDPARPDLPKFAHGGWTPGGSNDDLFNNSFDLFGQGSGGGPHKGGGRRGRKILKPGGGRSWAGGRGHATGFAKGGRLQQPGNGNQIMTHTFTCTQDWDCPSGQRCIGGVCTVYIQGEKGKIGSKQNPYVLPDIEVIGRRGGNIRSGKNTRLNLCYCGPDQGMQPCPCRVRRPLRQGGGINTGSPNSCIDRHGNNKPC